MSIGSLLGGIVHPGKSYQSIEARAIYFAGIAGTVSCITALFYFWGYEGVPIFGRVSIGTTAIVLSSVAAFIGYFLVLYQGRERRGQPSPIHKTAAYLNMFALSFVHGALVFLLATIVYFVFSEAFTGVMIDKYASSFIVAATVVVAAYSFYLIAANATTMMISSALAVFLVCGVLTSMITASDPYWWQMHISSLGTGGGISSYAFNLTLIIGGAVVISIANLIARDFVKLRTLDSRFKKANIGWVRTLLMLIGAGLVGVGLFPYDTHTMLHNISASGMFFLFVGMIIGLRPLVPSFSNAFFIFSYVIIGILVICLLLFMQVGYFDLTAFEMISFVILFSWLVVFIRQIAAALHDEQKLVRS